MTVFPNSRAGQREEPGDGLVTASVRTGRGDMSRTCAEWGSLPSILRKLALDWVACMKCHEHGIRDSLTWAK